MANTKITTNVIADDAITLDKMAGLARGKIIYGDSSGNPAALAVGSNGQVLKSDGTDISWGTDSSNDRDGAAVFNESGAAVDFRIEGDTVENLFFVDGSADKIGINTSSPGAWLEVKDDGSLGHDMVLIQGGGSSGDYNAIAVKANNGNELFKVNASSYHTYLPNGSCKLGIGMASGAGHSLDVAGDAQISKAGNGNDPILHVKDTADTECAWFEGNRAGDTGAFISVWHNPSTPQETNRSGIRFQADDDAGNKTNYATMTMFIDDHTNGSEDGNVQIAVASGGTLEEKVRIDADLMRFRGDAGSSFIRVDNRADGHDTGFEIYQNNSRKWEIHSDDSRTNALQIRPSGNSYYEFTQSGTLEVGLGNVADPTVLINSATGGDPTIIFDSVANRDHIIRFKEAGTQVGQITYVCNGDYIKFSAGSNNNSSKFLVYGTGDAHIERRLGIGSNTGASSDISIRVATGTSGSNWRFGGHVSNTLFYLLNEDNDGVYMSHGSSSWVTHSDERIKENITSLGTVLPDLVNMRCVKYNRKGKSDTKIGFIAQDWESKFPEVVDEDDGFRIDNGSIVGKAETESTDKVKAVSYTETIPILLKAIQELEARITELESS